MCRVGRIAFCKPPATIHATPLERQLMSDSQLLAMKREEREKQLVEAERSQQGKSRPKSARAARSSFGGRKAAATAAAEGDAVARGIDPETLRVRRALAQKLKSEVIGKS